VSGGLVRELAVGASGRPRPRGGGQAVTRARLHDHALVLDHGIPGACPPARSSVNTRRTLITALQAAATPFEAGRQLPNAKKESQIVTRTS